jgi:type III secretory pathway component EscS
VQSQAAKHLIFELATSTVEALNLSEAARIALLQEVMKDAKRNERAGLVACIVGVVVSVAGFSTTSLAGNSINLGIVGIVIAAIGFVVYLYYARVYLRFVGQLASMAFKSAVPCPRCAKELPEGDFAFCPFCGSPLKS